LKFLMVRNTTVDFCIARKLALVLHGFIMVPEQNELGKTCSKLPYVFLCGSLNVSSKAYLCV